MYKYCNEFTTIEEYKICYKKEIRDYIRKLQAEGFTIMKREGRYISLSNKEGKTFGFTTSPLTVIWNGYLSRAKG